MISMRPGKGWWSADEFSEDARHTSLPARNLQLCL
jgi:hypothetical protein